MPFVFVCFLVACGGDDDAERDSDALKNGNKSNEPTDVRARNGNLVRDGLNVVPMDLNRDDRPDQWTLTDAAGKTVRVERDLNFDGTVDIWQYPNPEAPEDIVEEEMDLDKDGRVDVVAFYDSGVVIRKELALDFSGTFTVFKYYDAKGKLLRVEQDDDGDGQIDRWSYFEDGRRVRIGWDDDGDGQPDRFDQLP